MAPRSALLPLFTLFLAFLGSCSCDLDKAIKIGFVGSITGKNSDLGVAERDAVQLAVENVNSSGGINGRMLSLIVRDDAFTPERAAEAVESLAREKVAAIIGPTGSSMA